jgi:hypothetical protein
MKLAAQDPWLPRPAAVIRKAAPSVLAASLLVWKDNFESRVDRPWRGRGLEFIGFVLLA